jgi:hypothetical protein
MLLFGSWGLFLLTSGVVLGVVIVGAKIVTGVGSRPLLYLVMLLVSVGIQLLGLGLLSEQLVSLRDALGGRQDLGPTPFERGEVGQGPGSA